MFQLTDIFYKICQAFDNDNWAVTWDFQQSGMCDQQCLRSAWAYAQSDQSLCHSLEYSMTVKLLPEHLLEFLILKRRRHRLVWVYICKNATLLQITCRGSYVFLYCILWCLKTFDSVWHNDLLLKLRQNGTEGKLLEWLNNYLNLRKQKVGLKSCLSGLRSIFTEVPQGSVLRTLLVLV